MKASSHIIREIHLDRMSISTARICEDSFSGQSIVIFQTFSKNQPHQKLHTIRYHHLCVVFSDNISDMLAVALYSFTSFFASIFNKAFSNKLKDQPAGLVLLCIKLVPAIDFQVSLANLDCILFSSIHALAVGILFVLSLNNNITIKIIHRLVTNYLFMLKAQK
ncbi:hypothetical protein ACJX0J_028029 [Zea mays]